MKKLLVILASVGLASCSGGADQEELRQWMNDATKGVRGKVPPLPQVKPYEPVAYDAGNLLDPFNPAKLVPDNKGGGKRPDFDRPREPLESYPLESLKYVGVVTKKGVSYAIIQVDGALYQVRTGNYLGQNFGVITKITESEVVLKELVQDAAGDWVERVSTLSLQGQEGAK